MVAGPLPFRKPYPTFSTILLNYLIYKQKNKEDKEGLILIWNMIRTAAVPPR